jgi:hypothetical protein
MRVGKVSCHQPKSGRFSVTTTPRKDKFNEIDASIKSDKFDFPRVIPALKYANWRICSLFKQDLNVFDQDLTFVKVSG